MKIATLLCVLLAATGVVTPAEASTAQESPFSAKATAAGYSPTEANGLQGQIDFYLQHLGGKQVDINKIVFDGGEVLLPLPGEERAREVGTQPTKAGANSAQASWGASLWCKYLYLCLFHDRDFKGPEVKLTKCWPAPDLRVIWAGVGSYADNESSGTYARFFDDGGGIYEVAAAGDVNAALNWRYVHDVRAC